MAFLTLFNRRGGFSPGSLTGLAVTVLPALSRSQGKLWQDTAKTIAATADGDPVRVAVCPYTAVEFTAPSDAARPLLYDETGGRWSLWFDGVDDRMSATVPCNGSTQYCYSYRATPADVVPFGESYSHIYRDETAGYSRHVIGVFVNGSGKLWMGTGVNLSVGTGPSAAWAGGTDPITVTAEHAGAGAGTLYVNGVSALTDGTQNALLSGNSDTMWIGYGKDFSVPTRMAGVVAYADTRSEDLEAYLEPLQ